MRIAGELVGHGGRHGRGVARRHEGAEPGRHPIDQRAGRDPHHGQAAGLRLDDREPERLVRPGRDVEVGRRQQLGEASPVGLELVHRESRIARGPDLQPRPQGPLAHHEQPCPQAGRQPTEGRDDHLHLLLAIEPTAIRQHRAASGVREDRVPDLGAGPARVEELQIDAQRHLFHALDTHVPQACVIGRRGRHREVAGFMHAAGVGFGHATRQFAGRPPPDARHRLAHVGHGEIGVIVGDHRTPMPPAMMERRPWHEVGAGQFDHVGTLPREQAHDPVDPEVEAIRPVAGDVRRRHLVDGRAGLHVDAILAPRHHQHVRMQAGGGQVTSLGLDVGPDAAAACREGLDDIADLHAAPTDDACATADGRSGAGRAPAIGAPRDRCRHPPRVTRHARTES